MSRLLAIRARDDTEAAEQEGAADATPRLGFATRLGAVLRAIAERVAIVARAASPAGDRERNHIRLWLKLRLHLPIEANRYVSVTKRPGPDYASWVARFDGLSASDRAAIDLHLAEGRLPDVAVVAVFAEGAVSSVGSLLTQLRSQMLQDWRAIIAVPQEDVPLLADAADDSRVSVIGDRRDASAWAAQLRGCTHVLLVGDGVTLRDRTLYAFAAAASANPGAQLIYADNDRLNADGSRDNPHFKPRFSPERHRRAVYLGACAMLCDEGNGFDPLIAKLAAGATMSAIIDSIASGLPAALVRHVPLLLYHQDLPLFTPRHCDEPVLPDDAAPSVAIIVPTKDRLDLLKVCIDSIEQRTDWPRDRYRIVVVDNNSEQPETLHYLKNARQLVVLRDELPFNYARINNRAAAAVPAELLVFLNNDTEIIQPDWLRRLAAFGMQEDVGAVGPKLLFPDTSVQHAGIVVGFRGVATHGLIGIARDDGGYGNLANLTREVSAVTGACLAMRGSVFQEIGGFDEALAVTFNDVALCLAAQARGYRNIYLADALIIHHESQSRGYDVTDEQISRNTRAAFHARARFLGIFKDDPFYNPNLSLDELYELAEPPRAERPWLSFARSAGLPLRVLLLSAMHDAEHDGAAVLALQASALVRAGFSVFVAGPRAAREFPYPACHRVHLVSAPQASAFAWRHAIDCVVIHTMPFFSMLRTLGEWPRSIIYDRAAAGRGAHRQRVVSAADAYEQRHCTILADRVYTNGSADTGADRCDVIVLPEPAARPEPRELQTPGAVPPAWNPVLDRFVDGIRDLCGNPPPPCHYLKS